MAITVGTKPSSLAVCGEDVLTGERRPEFPRISASHSAESWRGLKKGLLLLGQSYMDTLIL